MGETREFRIKLNQELAENVNRRGKYWKEDAHWLLTRIRGHIKSSGIQGIGFVDLDRDQIKIVKISDELDC
jgi:hypothetical protein